MIKLLILLGFMVSFDTIFEYSIDKFVSTQTVSVFILRNGGRNTLINPYLNEPLIRLVKTFSVQFFY
jgi:hypothetical protein